MDYADFVKTTDISNHNLQFYLDGMNEENGEISGVFKRVRRGDYGEHNKKILEEVEDKLKEILTCDSVRRAVIKEIGDRHWYTTRFLQEIGATWEHVEKANQEKLTKRKKEGVIMGHGDERENLPSHDCGKCEILSKECMEEGCEVMIYGAVAGEKCLLHSISFNNCG